MMFSLSYLPSAERLTVVVAKARNLKQPEDSKQVTSKKILYMLACRTQDFVMVEDDAALLN